MKMKRVILAALVMILAFSLMPVNAEAASTKTKLVVSKISLPVGGEYQLYFEYDDGLYIAPKGKKVTWSSNKKSVATIDKTGRITAKKLGTAKITAKVDGKKYTCTVKVIKPNASDVKEVKKIINAQKKLGAKLPKDVNKMNSYYYEWNDKGRLTGIGWSNCNLKGSISFAGLKELTFLNCYLNKLSKLDVSKNTKLKSLECSYNQLGSLNVSKNTKLVSLNCNNNQLSSLDVSKNIKLENLWCPYNKLSSLNVGKNTKLKSLGCDYNQLSSLDVSGCTMLKSLQCMDNQLTSLNVSKNTELESLLCNNNKISILDLTNNKKLTNFSCDNTVEVIGYNK